MIIECLSDDWSSTAIIGFRFIFRLLYKLVVSFPQCFYLVLSVVSEPKDGKGDQIESGENVSVSKRTVKSFDLHERGMPILILFIDGCASLQELRYYFEMTSC